MDIYRGPINTQWNPPGVSGVALIGMEKAQATVWFKTTPGNLPLYHCHSLVYTTSLTHTW